MTAAQEAWARCRHHIVAALQTAPGCETIEDVEACIADGSYIFFAGERSAFIAEVVHFKRKTAFFIHHGGGDLDELVNMEPKIVHLAKELGCDLVMGSGREGWKRVFQKHGYRLAWIVMVKEL